MNKRTDLIPMLILAVLLAGSPGLAQVTGLANTSKEGSLLIWPRVQTTGAGETYVTIANHSASAVAVKCFWEVKEDRSDPRSQSLLHDFIMQLGGSAAVVFRAGDGLGLDNRPVALAMGDGEEGALACWAVDPTGGKQISWNHLGGTAVIVDRDNTAPGATGAPSSGWEYSAWRFAANVVDAAGEFADGFWVGTVAGVDPVPANKLSLKASPTTVVTPVNCPGPDYSAAGCSLPNAAYDACPKYLTFDFLANSSGPAMTDGFAFNTVALAPCKMDLTGTTLNLSTGLAYTIWNENSLQITGPTRCVNGVSSSSLGALSVPRRLRIFRYADLHTPSGRFRVDGKASSTCGAEAVATPLVGVIWSRLSDGTGTVGTTGSTSGKETADYGYITWLPGGGYYQGASRLQ